MNGMPSFGRGDWMEGFQLHPDWMEWTMIMGAIALVVIAAALIALAVKVWLARDDRPTRSIAGTPVPAATYPVGPSAATGSADAADAETPTRTMPAADHAAAAAAPEAAAPAAAPAVAETPRAILDRRYAAGEIDRDEYRALRADIDDAPAPDGDA